MTPINHRSNYNFRIQTIQGGLIGHLKLVLRSAKGETELHRSKENILAQKSSRKDVAWFKRSDPQCRAVLFVPETPG